MAVNPDNEMIVRNAVYVVCQHLPPCVRFLIVAADTPPAHISLGVPVSVLKEGIGAGHHALIRCESVAAEIGILAFILEIDLRQKRENSILRDLPEAAFRSLAGTKSLCKKFKALLACCSSHSFMRSHAISLFLAPQTHI